MNRRQILAGAAATLLVPAMPALGQSGSTLPADAIDEFWLVWRQAIRYDHATQDPPGVDTVRSALERWMERRGVRFPLRFAGIRHAVGSAPFAFDTTFHGWIERVTDEQKDLLGGPKTTRHLAVEVSSPHLSGGKRLVHFIHFESPPPVLELTHNGYTLVAQSTEHVLGPGSEGNGFVWHFRHDGGYAFSPGADPQLEKAWREARQRTFAELGYRSSPSLRLSTAAKHLVQVLREV